MACPRVTGMNPDPHRRLDLHLPPPHRRTILWLFAARTAQTPRFRLNGVKNKEMCSYQHSADRRAVYLIPDGLLLGMRVCMSSLSRKPSLCFLGINVSHESSHVSFENLGEVGLREIPFDKHKNVPSSKTRL